MDTKALRYFVVAVGLAVAQSCSATSLDLWDFGTAYRLATVVAKVHIVSADPIAFDDNKSEVCGYRIKADVLELFKGQKATQIIFFSGSNEDVGADHPDYFVIANRRASSSVETVLDSRKCDTRGIELAVNSDFQTVFPIRNDPSTDKPEFLMVSRHSPFTTGNFASIDGYVSMFAVYDDRIYAYVSWDKVAADLATWAKSPPAAR